MFDYPIDDAKGQGLLRTHVKVPLHALLNLSNGLASVLGKDVIETLAMEENLLGLDGNVTGLSLCTPMRLMNHDASVGQGTSLSRLTSCKEQRGKGGHHSHSHRVHRTLDELKLKIRLYLDSVIDGKSIVDRATGRVEVEKDGLLRIL